MTPYSNVYNWLSDSCSGGRVVGKDEMFNKCHARLRNVLECVFWCY